MGHVGISADRKTVGNACKNLEVIFGLERGVSQEFFGPVTSVSGEGVIGFWIYMISIKYKTQICDYESPAQDKKRGSRKSSE